MKRAKILSVALVGTLALSTPALLTGCNKKNEEKTSEETVALSSKDAAYAVARAAAKYQKDHGVTNFADTTYTVSTNFASTGNIDLTYKLSEDAEDYVDGNFKSEYKSSSTVTVSTYKVTRGEGEDAFTVVHLNVAVTNHLKNSYYETDENELLKHVEEDTTTTKKYTFASKIEEDEVVYYATKTSKVVEAGEDDVETKEYYKFDGEYDYEDVLRDYLEKLNQLVNSAYFSLGDTEMAIMFGNNYTKTGDRVEFNMEVTLPQIREDNPFVTTMNRKTSFNGENIDTASITESIENMNGYSGLINISMEIKVISNANAINLADTTGYEEAEEVIDVGEFPIHFGLDA